jgi:hypothetical protein
MKNTFLTINIIVRKPIMLVLSWRGSNTGEHIIDIRFWLNALRATQLTILYSMGKNRFHYHRRHRNYSMKVIGWIWLQIVESIVNLL